MAIEHEQPLSVTTVFESNEEDEFSTSGYRKLIEHNLSKILPLAFFEPQETPELARLHREQIFKQLIPLVTYSEVRQFPSKLSFFALSKFRVNSFKFFFEMISRWLMPGKRLNVALVYAADFRINGLSNDVFTFYEVVIHIDKKSEFEEIMHNYPLIEEEIILGIHSEFYAHRLLEIKGISADDKTAVIQGLMAFLMKRLPQIYDVNLFSEMQHVLVTCRDDFKEARQSRHLSRIIGFQYLFRKNLRELLKKKPHKRHLQVKLFRPIIKAVDGPKKVLSLLVGMTFLKDHETFEYQHLVKAMQHSLSTAQPIDNSYYINKHGSENICLIYLEVEKKDGSDFTFAEFRKLRRELPLNLKNCVGQKLHSIFMPRNEEEIMRNMVTLANQIRYLRDIPQISILFDEQASNHLYFTVILARLIKNGSSPIPLIFKTTSHLEYIHDRTKIMGYIRKKYPKEVSVFHLKLHKENFVRADHSIDLYKARQAVVKEISRVLGEIRDYNGGMISKQHDLLADISRLLQDSFQEYDQLLLENFFYSLAPVVVRGVVEPRAFITLFTMLVDGLKIYKQENFYLKFHQEPYNQYAMVISEDMAVKELVIQTLEKLNIPSNELVYAYVKAYGNMCIGYICSTQKPQKKEAFFTELEKALKDWKSV